MNVTLGRETKLSLVRREELGAMEVTDDLSQQKFVRLGDRDSSRLFAGPYF